MARRMVKGKEKDDGRKEAREPSHDNVSQWVGVHYLGCLNRNTANTVSLPHNATTSPPLLLRAL